MIRRGFGKTGIIIAVAGLMISQYAPAAEKITSIEGITEYRLKNGVRVLLFPDSSKSTVTVNLTLFVGSRHEGYGETGMAHLLEHMLFKGTPDHPNIPKALQDRGADFNGSTWFDRTNYYETLPASDENLEFALKLEADRMVNSYVKAEDLASEMTVVRNEFERGENMPASILEQRMMAVAYEWHNYGKSTIGNRADIERVPIDRLKNFYKKFYQPDNAMVVIAGRFDPETALRYVEKYFGSLKTPDRQLETTYTEEPAQDGERSVTLQRVGDVAVVAALYHVPSAGHEDFASLEVLQNIMTLAPSGRLYKALVETKKAANVDGSVYPLHDPGVIQFQAEVAQGNDPNVVLGAMLDTIDQVVAKGVTEEEVERARQRLLKNRELSAADSTQIAVELSEWAAMGDWRLYFLRRDRLEQVTAESVQRVAAKYLTQNNRTVGVYLPTKESKRAEVPPTPDLAAVIGDYKGREDLALGEEFDVSPEAIEKRTVRTTVGSGIKAALLEKRTRGKTVIARLTLRYGNEKNLQGKQKAAEFLPTMMMRGTKNLTRQQIQDELDKNRAQLAVSGNPGEVTFVIQTKRESLPQVFDLLRQIVREPSLPESELEILKQAQLASYEKQLTDPQSLAVNAARRRITPYPKGDPRYVPTIPEQIEFVKALKRDDVANLYEEFLSGQAGEFTVVGDFSKDEVLPLVNKFLADWKSEQPYAHIPRSGKVGDTSGDLVIETPDKANATYFATLALPMRDDNPDYAPLVIGDFILGGGTLSSRLGDRVRQKDGLSYGVGSRFDALALDDRATFYMYAIANPQNMDKVKSAISEELDRLIAGGVNSNELDQAKQAYLQGKEVERTDDANLAQILENTSYANRTMKHYAELEQEVLGLTPKSVQAALKRHIDPKGLFVVTAGDFAAATTAANK